MTKTNKNEFIDLLQTTSLESMGTSEELDSFLKKLDFFEESLTAPEFEEIMVLLDEDFHHTFGWDRETLNDRSWLDDYLNEGLTWG